MHCWWQTLWTQVKPLGQGRCASHAEAWQIPAELQNSPVGQGAFVPHCGGTGQPPDAVGCTHWF